MNFLIRERTLLIDLEGRTRAVQVCQILRVCWTVLGLSLSCMGKTTLCWARQLVCKAVPRDLNSRPKLPFSIMMTGNTKRSDSLQLWETKVNATELVWTASSMCTLEHLDMKSGLREELPGSFPCLRSLKDVQLMGTKIRRLPTTIGNLGKLPEYYLHLKQTWLD